MLAECDLPSVDAHYDQAHVHLHYRLTGMHGNNAMLLRAVFARPGPDTLAHGSKASARWFFKEPRFITAWLTTERTANALIAENEAADEENDESVANGRDTSPETAWKDAIHAAAKSLNRQALIREIAELKAPASRYFTAEADFRKCKHSYLKNCDAGHATTMLKARTNTLAVASVVCKFEKNVSKFCTACTKDGRREVEETLEHFVIECPALTHLRNESAIICRAVALRGGAATARLDAVLNCEAKAMPNVCATLAKMWKLRCQIHFGAIAGSEGEAAGPPIRPRSAAIGDLAPGDGTLRGRLSAEAPETELDSPRSLAFVRPATNNSAASSPATHPTHAPTNTSPCSLGANGPLPQAES